jgi:hypothetical protein
MPLLNTALATSRLPGSGWFMSISTCTASLLQMISFVANIATVTCWLGMCVQVVQAVGETHC